MQCSMIHPMLYLPPYTCSPLPVPPCSAKLTLPEDQVAKLLEDLENKYLSDGISEFAKKWNDERRAVLAKAVKELLLPQVRREEEGGAGIAAGAACWCLSDGACGSMLVRRAVLRRSSISGCSSHAQLVLLYSCSFATIALRTCPCLCCLAHASYDPQLTQHLHRPLCRSSARCRRGCCVRRARWRSACWARPCGTWPSGALSGCRWQMLWT